MYTIRSNYTRMLFNKNVQKAIYFRLTAYANPHQIHARHVILSKYNMVSILILVYLCTCIVTPSVPKGSYGCMLSRDLFIWMHFSARARKWTLF